MGGSLESTRPAWETQENSSQESSVHTDPSSRNSTLPNYTPQTTSISFDPSPASSLGRDQPLADRWSQRHPQNEELFRRPRTLTGQQDEVTVVEDASARLSELSPSLVKGVKRTANGLIKSDLTASEDAHTPARLYSHARNASADSIQSTAGEVRRAIFVLII